jgi:hypothetical protein
MILRTLDSECASRVMEPREDAIVPDGPVRNSSGEDAVTSRLPWRRWLPRAWRELNTRERDEHDAADLVEGLAGVGRVPDHIDSPV